MNKFYLCFLNLLGFIGLGCLLAPPLLAQVTGAGSPRFTISGTVRDSASGEDLIGATVQLVETGSGAITNAYGYYSVSVPAGTYTLRAVMEGYRLREKKISVNQDVTVNLELAVFVLQTVEIETQADVIRETNMGREHMEMSTVRSIPMLFGEADIIRAIQMLPGVQAAGDGNTGFNVRGGGIDQNLILLDEATVFNPSHLLGFFSVFNSDAVKGADLYKGGIPARYGGRLSSVLDVRMNEGNMKRFGATGGIGTIASRLTLQGPIVKDRGSFIISGRRTYADMFLALSSDPQVNKNQLYFYDGNLKANYRIDSTNRIFLSGYIGRDVLGFKDLFGFRWGNKTGTARWNHIFSPRLFLNTTAIYSNFDYMIRFKIDDNNWVRLSSGLQNYSIKLDFNWYPSGNAADSTRTSSRSSAINFGMQSTYMDIQPGDVRAEGQTNYVNNIHQTQKHGWETAIYWDHDARFSERFSVRYGVRLSHFAAMGPGSEYRYGDDGKTPVDTIHYKAGFIKHFYNAEPRLGLNYRLDVHNSVKFSFDRTVQYIHLLNNSASSLPTALWYTSGTFIKPQTAEQIAGGYFRTLGPTNGWEISGELYYKFLHNQLDFKNFANLQFNDKVELEVFRGKGRAYGAEFMIKKTQGKLQGWASYTYARAFRTFNQDSAHSINGGKEYRAVNDKPHYITLVATYRPTERWTLGVTFLFASGQVVTMPVGAYFYNNTLTPQYAERNNYRLQPYNRLDLSATLHFKKKNPETRWQHSLNMSVYNAYSRKNPWAVIVQTERRDKDVPGTEHLVAKKIYLFPIVPSVTYNFSF